MKVILFVTLATISTSAGSATLPKCLSSQWQQITQQQYEENTMGNGTYAEITPPWLFGSRDLYASDGSFIAEIPAHGVAYFWCEKRAAR